VKFGVLQFFSWPGRRVPLPTVYERAFQRAEIMDQTGYDAVWLAEHHFSTYSVCPSINIMGTHIAARTERLRIGTAVSLAPFYHPLRLAEEIALLDLLSGGRVNWGAGRGFDPTEYRAFDIPNEESYPRFRETVDIVTKAWQNERLTYHGDFYDFEDVEVLPKPLQDPMPVWLAATSPDAIRWCAQNGYTILMDPHASHEDIAAKRAIYQTELEAAGYSIEGREIPMARNIALAETQEEAEAIARNGAQFMFGSYLRKGTGGAPRDPVAPEVTAQEKTQDTSALPRPEQIEEDPVERYVNDVVICGTPDKVIDDLQRLQQELPLDYLMCTPLSHSSFELFTEKVLPKFL
jgi:alkanesulfonate monooxygenase SsuD/methylene tetrahydromethanopterin reductase-like flavin-dependent oxidoreductase (luciferase family)